MLLGTPEGQKEYKTWEIYGSPATLVEFLFIYMK